MFSAPMNLIHCVEVLLADTRKAPVICDEVLTLPQTNIVYVEDEKYILPSSAVDSKDTLRQYSPSKARTMGKYRLNSKHLQDY
jgi:hypothetical protein